jgi:hypothetical protein
MPCQVLDIIRSVPQIDLCISVHVLPLQIQVSERTMHKHSTAMHGRKQCMEAAFRNLMRPLSYTLSSVGPCSQPGINCSTGQPLPPRSTPSDNTHSRHVNKKILGREQFDVTHQEGTQERGRQKTLHIYILSSHSTQPPCCLKPDPQSPPHDASGTLGKSSGRKY